MKEKILNTVIRMAITKRPLIYISTAVVTVLLGSAIFLLKFDMRWTALMPESMPEVRESRKIDADFLQPGNMIIAITGKDPVQLEKVTDEVTAMLKRELVGPKGMSMKEILKAKRYATHVYGGLPQKWLYSHMLALTKPKDAERLTRMQQDPGLLPYLARLNDDLEREYTDTESVQNQERDIVARLDALKEMLESLEHAADGKYDEAEVRRTVRDLTIGKPYFFSLDNTMSLVMVAAAFPFDDADALVRMDHRIEELLVPFQKKYPDMKFERTGMTAVARDEMDSVGPYTAGLTLLAFVLIYFLLVWNFRSFLTPALALIPIAVGIIWSMGVIGLTLGALNLITSMMMVVLLGLGIDYSIHIAGRFQDEIAAGRSVEEALRLTVGQTGKAVITGALTTAVAFLSIMIAEAQAVFQFGFCAGIGVLLTLVAALWLYPALLASSAERLERQGKVNHAARDFVWLGGVAATMGKRYRWVIAAIIVLTVGGIVAGANLKWEYNFMNLEPPNLRSVELQDEIVQKFRLSITMSMLTVPTVEKSRELREKFKKRRVVGDVNDISAWVSRPDFEQARVFIRRLRNGLRRPEGSGLSRSADRKMLAKELDRLWANLVEIQALSITGGQDRVVDKTKQLVADRANRPQGFLRRLADRFRSGSDIDWRTVDRFAAYFAGDMYGRIRLMAQNDLPVTVDMLPRDIYDQYASKNGGEFVMHIMSRKNLFHKDELEHFKKTITEIAPGVTGMPQLVLLMNNTTVESGRKAMLAAIAVIIMVLLLDFRRPLLAAVAFLPLVAGLALTLGIMWLLGEKLNYLNMIALPVIIGIGIDDGVHFIHRYLEMNDGDLRLVVTGIGRPILMTTLTTMIGFGILMIYLMRGVASLGFVLSIGVGSCFLVTVTLLPAMIRLLENKIKKNQEETK